MTSTQQQLADIVDANRTMPALPTNKKNDILERLNKRNKDRQNELDVKLEQRNREQSQGEGVDYFAQTFTKRAREIEEQIKIINDGNTIGDNTVLARQFVEITMQIQELERYLTNSTMFLTDFKIKQCQTLLTTLSNSSEETRLRLLPKKKFGFSGKKVASKPIVNPKVGNQSNQDTQDNALIKGAKAATKSSAFEWTISNRKHEHIVLKAHEVNGKDITATHLQDCLIELQGHAGSVQVSHIKNCTFLCGPIARSFFAEHCQLSTLAMACQQLRLHSSTKMRIYLHVTCRAIIEDCNDIDISNYNYDYDGIEADFAAAGLDKLQNNYTDVADFNWLSPDVHSPNWSVVELNLDEHDKWQLLRQQFAQSNQNSAVSSNDKSL